jgi:hypothetical protein
MRSDAQLLRFGAVDSGPDASSDRRRIVFADFRTRQRPAETPSDHARQFLPPARWRGDTGQVAGIRCARCNVARYYKPIEL